MISSHKRFGLLCTVCFPCCSSRSSEKCSENFSLSKKISMDFLFSSLAKAQILKKILPFGLLKVSMCSVNLNRQGLEYETVCVGENPYLLNVSSNVLGLLKATGCRVSLRTWRLGVEFPLIKRQEGSRGCPRIWLNIINIPWRQGTCTACGVGREQTWVEGAYGSSSQESWGCKEVLGIKCHSNFVHVAVVWAFSWTGIPDLLLAMTQLPSLAEQ